MAAEAQRRNRQNLLAHQPASRRKPRNPSMQPRLGEEGGKPEPGRGRGIKTNDKFAANAVPGIAARVVQRDGHARPAQGESERKSGKAAADDFDGTHRRT
jgi:hypothetical protein